jgi:hypothetical protein
VLSISDTGAGRRIDLSDGHFENADLLIVRSFEPDSNVTDLRLSNPLKHEAQRTSTDEGTQIDSSEEQPDNASSPIAFRIDPRANVNDFRDVIPERASGSTVSDAGRQSDSKRWHLKNALDSIVSRFDPDSKTPDDKREHSAKQHFRMKRTDFGIEIDLRERQLLKADSPISERRE